MGKMEHCRVHSMHVFSLGEEVHCLDGHSQSETQILQVPTHFLSRFCNMLLINLVLPHPDAVRR